jgi:hypothetical protein
MPLLIPIIGISVLAAYLLRSTGLFVPAIVNAIANFWSLGVLWNYRGKPVSGNYERVVGGVAMLTSVLAVVFLITYFVQR